MSRLTTINPSNATGRAKELLDGIQARLGMTPNLYRVMANSPAVLDAALGFDAALSGGTLPAALREQIALTVGEANQCEYCLAAHTAIGKFTGLSDEQVLTSRRASSQDAKEHAALQFARQIVDSRGFVSDEQVSAVRAAGFGDGEIAEIVANVAKNIFTNYFNHVSEAEVDFPAAPKLDASPNAVSDATCDEQGCTV